MISIIVPFHNAGDTLEACLKSVSGQSFGDWELILVDDGSTDGSAEAAREYAGSDPRVSLVRLAPGEGVSGARNAGLGRVRGEYFTFLDADDLLAPEALERLEKLLRENGADLAAVGFSQFAGEPPVPEHGIRPAGVGDVRRLDGKEFLTERVLRGDNHVWAKLYRTDRFGSLRFDTSLTIGEDMLYLVMASVRIKCAAVTEEELYLYRNNPSGAISRPFTRSYLDQLACWEKAERWIKDNLPDVSAGEETRSAIAGMKVTAVMLIASKIAVLPADKRREYRDAAGNLKRTLKECGKVPGMRRRIPRGYGVKSAVFKLSPGLYYFLYGRFKQFFS